MGGAVPQPPPSGFPLPLSRVGPTPAHLVTTAASLRLGHFLHHRLVGRRFHLGLLLHSSNSQVALLKDVWHKSYIRFKGINFLHWSEDVALAAQSSCMWFFSGGENRNNSRDIGRTDSETSRRVPLNVRGWTNALLVINVLVYAAQIATQGKLLLLGAKINSLINKGQFWRLATSSFLHANIGHLMVNCYSLNSIGPSVESISGPRRYLAIYFTSAIASSAMSYWLCKAPAVGASGAIFGLVGSFAVFVLRHKGMVKDGKEDLQHITHVILLNMLDASFLLPYFQLVIHTMAMASISQVIGLLSKGIDNWGHLGGLLGGAATSWLIGPAWRYESLSNDGQKVFADRAPIFSLIKPKRTPR